MNCQKCGRHDYGLYGYCPDCDERPEHLIKHTTCTWTYSDDEDSWDAECGHKFSLNDGTPAENGMRYCHYCGQTIRQVESPGDSQS